MPISGVIPSPPDSRDYHVSRIAPPVALPGEVRLDDKILSIRDQFIFPTCVGKTGASIVSAGLREELSSIYLYAKCKKLDGIPHLDGTYPRTACQVLVDHGICTDKTLPYSMMSNPMPTLKTIHHAEAASRKVTRYARANGIADIRQALANGHLLMGCLMIGDNFINCNDNTVIGTPTGNLYGYHAITVCGFSDTRQALRIANSWGKWWGDGGFAWLSYNVLNQPMHWPEAWVIEVVREEPKPKEEISDAEKSYPDRIFRDLKRLKKN